MSTGVIIAIVVAALIVLALVVLLSRKGRERKLESNRQEARELRRGAEVDRASADKTQAEADMKAAEARRHDAEAADEQQREARERHLEAARLDPDVDESAAAEEYDQEQGRKHGITSHGYESDAPSGDRDHDGVADRGDERVEHYERTETAGAERERVYEQDDSGDVVRDEESRRPRT